MTSNFIKVFGEEAKKIEEGQIFKARLDSVEGVEIIILLQKNRVGIMTDLDDLIINVRKLALMRGREHDIKLRNKLIQEQEILYNRINSIYNNFHWKQGVNYSDYKKDQYTFTNTISNGFHVFLKKQDAILERDDWGQDSSEWTYFVRKVYCKPDDLIAVGEWNGFKSAVFSKLYARFD